MKHLIQTTARAGLAGLCLLAVTVVGTAQEEKGPDEKAPDEKTERETGKDETDAGPENPFAPQQDLQAEMRELFHKVERTLKRIDVRLANAGAGDVPLEEVEDSGLDDLLRNARDGGEQVVSDIDRILEIAQQMGGGT